MVILMLAMILLSACGNESRWQDQYDLGMKYLTEGNYEEAIVAFSEAIEIDPNNALAYIGRGNAYTGSGDDNLALALMDFQKAIQLDEQNADAYLGIADVYILQGNHDAVMEILKEALEKTGNSDSVSNRISEFETEGNSQEEIAANPESIEENTENTVGQDEKEIVFDEMLVADDDLCMIKINDFKLDSAGEYILDVEFENKSSEKQYNLTIRAAVNGVQCSEGLQMDEIQLPAGEKKEQKFNLSQYAPAGEDVIGNYTDFELTFRVYEDESWDTITEETIHIYPYGEDEAVKYVREAQPSDQVIVDNEYITATVTGYEKEDMDDTFYVDLFIVNKTDFNIHLYVEDASLNGNEISGFMGLDSGGERLYVGNSRYSTVMVYGTDLEGMSQDDIEEVSFELSAYMNDLVTEIFNEEIILNP